MSFWEDFVALKEVGVDFSSFSESTKESSNKKQEWNRSLKIWLRSFLICKRPEEDKSMCSQKSKMQTQEKNLFKFRWYR